MFNLSTLSNLWNSATSYIGSLFGGSTQTTQPTQSTTQPSYTYPSLPGITWDQPLSTAEQTAVKTATSNPPSVSPTTLQKGTEAGGIVWDGFAPGQTPAAIYNPSIPATSTQVAPPLTFTSRTATPSVPTMSAGGAYVPPPVAPGGASGTGGFQFNPATAHSTPSLPSSFGLGSTGGASGVGGFSYGGMVPQTFYGTGLTDEDKEKMRREGKMTSWDYMSLTGKMPTTAVGALDAGKLSAEQEGIGGTVSGTMDETIGGINEGISTSIQQGAPSTQNIIQTPSTSSILASLAPRERMNFQQTFDGIMKSMGMEAVAQERRGMQQIINTMKDELKFAVDNIKNDPNIPKSLRDRRVRSIVEAYEPQIKAYAERLAELNANVSEMNQVAQLALGVWREQNDDERAIRQENLNIFSMLLDTGVQFSKEDAQLWGSVVGLSPETIMQMSKKSGVGIDRTVDLGDRVQVFYNDGTRETLKKGVSPSSSTATGGNITSGALVISRSNLQQNIDALNASRGPDGYVDPTIYLNLYEEWISSGGKPDDFTKYLPPNIYVNPANTWLPKNLMPELSAENFEAKINEAFTSSR